jgi:hypothetical protein
MDDLDRLYRRLVQNIRSTRPEYLQIPFTVQELYEQLVPYRHNRRELAIESNQDYEHAVARLLSGERGYVLTDAAMRDALLAELGNPTGDAGIFKEFAQVQVSLAPVATNSTPPGATPGAQSTSPLMATLTPTATRAASGPTSAPASTPAPTSTPTPVEERTPAGVSVTEVYDALSPSEAIPSTAQPAATAALLSSLTPVDIPTGCRFCGGTLPDDRDVNYCPHCGENLKTKRCPACGGEMDTTWRFCVTCGRRAQ